MGGVSEPDRRCYTSGIELTKQALARRDRRVKYRQVMRAFFVNGKVFGEGGEGMGGGKA